MAFVKMSPKEMPDNIFEMIQDRWLLVTGGTAEYCNPMTAAWASMGVFWKEYVITAYLRPQRYTCKMLDENEYFSVCVLPEEYRSVLNYCGRVSGADEDKGKNCGLTIKTAECGAPYFEESDIVFICKKLYTQQMDPAGICDHSIDVHYAAKDYHRMFWGGIVELYKKA